MSVPVLNASRPTTWIPFDARRAISGDRFTERSGSVLRDALTIAASRHYGRRA